MFLDRILAVKQEELSYRRSRSPIKELKGQVKDTPPVRDFYAAVTRAGTSRASGRRGRGETGAAPVNLIAEIKKASPSRGVIRQDFDPATIARTYEQAGARAISILTDEVFFMGHSDYLALVRNVVSLPLLRKEFIINDYQLYESRALGADAVLLIAAILAPSQLEDYLGLAAELGLSALVEVHTAPEAILAAPAGNPLSRVGHPAGNPLGGHPAGARLVGINNRDLQSFKTDLETTFNLLPLIPAETAVVSESGIRTHEQLRQLGEAGVDAVLVGEALMAQDDIAAAVRRLLEGETAHGEG